MIFRKILCSLAKQSLLVMTWKTILVKERVTYEKFHTAENEISVKIVPFSLTFEHSLKSKVNRNSFR